MNASLERRKDNIETIAAVSPLQQGILFHSLRSKEHDPYLYQIVFSLTGRLDLGALERAWQLAVDRHQVLRAEYRWEETATPLQVIYKRRSVSLERLDFRGQSEAEQLERLRSVLDEERRQGYDFRGASGLTLRLVTLGEELHWLAWSYHHVTLDGWSMAVVLGDAFGFYQELERGALPRARSALPYTAYLDWLHKQDQSQAVAYWKDLLSGVEAATPLPRSAEGGEVAYAEQALRLSREESELVSERARRLGVTLNTLVQGAWALLLGRYSGQREVVFGSTVSGRALPLPEIEAAAGLFINTLPVRVALDGKSSVAAFLSGLQQQNLDSRRYEHTPLLEIRRVAGLSGDAGLFDNVVVFDNYPVDAVLERQPRALRVAPVRLFSEDMASSAGRNNYALTLNVVTGSQIILTLAYRSEQFHAARINELAEQLKHLLFCLAARPDDRLGSIGLATGSAELPEGAAAAPCPAGSASAALTQVPTVLEAFAAQVLRAPEALALVSESRSYTFGALDRASSRVAGYLQAQGLGAEDRVGLCAERGSEFVVLLLGILKAGAAYVPLDAKLPAARLRKLTQSSGARCLLATPRTGALAREASVDLGITVAVLPEILDLSPGEPTRPAVLHPEQAAYMIFTSGSTGSPKGVVVSHGALGRYVSGLLERLALDPGASMAMVSTIAADLGHTVLFGALCSGGPLHLIAEEQAFDPDSFAEYLSRHEIAVLKIVPSHLKALLHAAQPARALPCQALIVGGESTDWALVEQLRRLRPSCRIINHYGPTETTVGVCTYELLASAPGQAAQGRTLPIGRALSSVSLYVFDPDLNRLPSCVPGELYIGGERLARGYFGNASATAERFVPDPASAGGRLYRTGDRVQLGSTGELEFLGRVDRQVKIRGYRVELGEIEARLLEHPALREAVVLTRASTGGTVQLVAYVVPSDPPGALPVASEGEPETLPEALAAHLARQLPDYMLPSRILVLKQLPLTANGKLDRQALPWEESAAVQAPPEALSPVEQQLVEVWKEVLRVEQVGLDDNFFRLGGDSILSLQVIARARRRGVKLTPKQLFDHQTVRGLASVATVTGAAVAGAGPSAATTAGPTSPAPARDVPLLPLQARFFEQLQTERQRYSQSVLLRPSEPLAPGPLGDALAALAQAHPALELRYREQEPGRWQQTIPAAGATLVAGTDPKPTAPLWLRTLADEANLGSCIQEAQHSLDLTQGPLWRALLAQLPDGSQRLFVVVHHLAVDGVSWRVLLEDLETAYRQRALGTPLVLPSHTSSLADWSERLQAHARSASVQAELPYWLAQLADVRPALPESKTEPLGSGWGSVALALDRDTTRQLLSEAPEAYRTEVGDLLLTALARALCKTNGQKSVHLLLEGHGREPLFDDLDLSRSVGWFTSIYPVRLRPAAGTDSLALGASLKAVKQQLRSIPQRGIGYGLLRYAADDATRARFSGTAEPDATFNYLGQFDQTFEAGALLLPDASTRERSEEEAALTGSLSIDGQVYAGELRLRLSYARSRHAPAHIERLAQALQAELEGLIEHCVSGAHGVTPSDFPLIGLSQAELDELPLVWHEVEDLYPLSPMQEGLLLHTLLEPGSGIYLMQHDHRIHDAIDRAAFEQAWQHVAREHAALRTRFVWNEGGMLQAVQRTAETSLEFKDWRALPPEQQEHQLAELLEQELREGFDLARLPLWRVRLLRMGDAAYRFVFSNHHILMDAWSRAHLLQDVFSVYQALQQGNALPRAARVPYRQFIAWLETQASAPSEAYWRGVLRGFEQATALPSDRPLGRRSGLSRVGDVALFLTAQESARLNGLASQHQLTVNTFVQAAWALTLRRYSGQTDVLFGVTVAGRPVDMPELERAVGLFINSIPLRVQLPAANVPTRDFLHELLRQNVSMREHEHLPLVRIQAAAEVARGQALFHSLFVFENAPVDVELLEGAERMHASAIGGRTHTNYPMTVVVYPGDRLGLHLSYDERFFERATAQAMLGEFERLLHELVQGFERPFGELSLLPPGQRAQLLGAWNDTNSPLPVEAGYVPLFEERVRRHPERIAARCGDAQLSFAGLDARSTAIAGALLAAGVTPDRPVALLAERGLELLASIVGILKAGAAYVPLDPKHPPRRIHDVLGQCQPAAILSQRRFSGLLDEALACLPAELRPRQVWLEDVALAATTAPALPRSHARSLAYVIYTSGSTGVPKGAMVEHAGMLNNQLSKLPWFQLSENDVIAQTASQCFDISVWQLLTAPLGGARVEIIPDDIAHDPSALLAHVAARGVSVLESVPSLIQALLGTEQTSLGSLRWLISTGEALSPELARRWLERHPKIALANAYGPAECSDDVALSRIEAPPRPDEGYAPIGTPTDNNRLYVLDAGGELAAVGVVGELCIAGLGVGRGYLRDPRRSAEAFRPNPFARTAGERLYHSGDLARFRDDGVLECVGRIDHQVKVRGYRIELGEIEARLLEHPSVLSAVVVAHENATAKRLVAYVAAECEDDAERAALSAELTGQLRARLPDYMLPAQLVVLAELPLGQNGKVDRRALPAPEWADRDAYIAPESVLGQTLARIWQRVLGVERVGASDNFFERGGDSLLAAQVVSRIRQELKLSVPLRLVFETQTLRELELAVERDGRRLEASHGWGR